MKKIAAVLLLVIAAHGLAQAQKGQNAVGVVAEGGLSIPDADLGWGGYVKGYYGIGKSAQLTATAGISQFVHNPSTGEVKTTTRLIPVLIGYKQHFSLFHIKSLYVEPQAGFGELGGKVDFGGDYARPSGGAFFGAIGAGVDIKRFELGARYQFSRETGSPESGLWYNRKFQLAAIHVGYRIL